MCCENTYHKLCSDYPIYVMKFYASTMPDWRKHYAVDQSVGPSCVCYQTCKHGILKTSEPILVQLVHGARELNDQVWWSGGQTSSTYKAKQRFVGLTEASVSTPFDWSNFAS